MTTILAYGIVTERKPVALTNKIQYVINDNSAAYTTNGSLIDRTIHQDRAGFFVVDSESNIVDYEAFGYKDHYVDLQKKRAADLKLVTKRLTSACKNVNRNELQLVAGALGATVGATVFVSGAATVLTSLFTGDITGTLGGAAGSAVGAVMAYISYDNMTAAQKNIYNTCKQFEAALETYHLVCIKYAPEHMKDLPMYEPEFSDISKMLRAFFPHFGEKDLTYNQPNWATA